MTGHYYSTEMLDCCDMPYYILQADLSKLPPADDLDEDFFEDVSCTAVIIPSLPEC